MRKYMVIDCCEREIGGPEFFDTVEKAQIRLFELFFENCHLIDKSKWELEIHDIDELRDVVEALQNEGLLDDENDYNYDSAWCTTVCHNNWDGKVIEINLPTLH